MGIKVWATLLNALDQYNEVHKYGTSQLPVRTWNQKIYKTILNLILKKMWRENSEEVLTMRT